jgi:hypothetical protein
VITALWAAPFIFLAACGAYAARDRIRDAVLRARWAWRCRGKPVPGDGERLDLDEEREFSTAVRSWKYARPERSRM